MGLWCGVCAINCSYCFLSHKLVQNYQPTLNTCMKIQDEMPPEWGEWIRPKKDLMMEPPKLKLAPKREKCECGDTVCDRRINHTYVPLEKYSNHKFCSQICQNCLKWYNPQSKQWESVEQTHYVQRKAIIKDYLKNRAK